VSEHREFKDYLYEQFARVGKAISNPHRLELLELLAQGERTVDELAEQGALSVANASQHLQALRRAHLVQVRREGLHAYYRLTSDEVIRLCHAMRALASQQFAEIDRLVSTYLGARDSLDAVDAKTLLRRLNDGDIVVLDVRPEEEHRAGHIAGARSIPVEHLERRLGELPRDRDVIAYCRGPYCVFADEAVSLLRERGFRAARFADGFPEWRLAGLPVEVSG
jgi:rhodanese-related sulfurtransferase/DNA-binding HxlR family transcriptional regulator